MKLIQIDNLPFVVGKQTEIISFLTNACIHQHSSKIILACSLNDLAIKDSNEEIGSWYSQISYCTTDGMPLVWYAKTKYVTERVYGPQVLVRMLNTIQQSAPQTKHIFLGPSKKTLLRLSNNLHKRSLQIQPFVSFVVPHENIHMDMFVSQVLKIKPNVIWIGISSPRQVFLASQLKRALPHVVIFCVGAAFDLLSGEKHMAPTWMQRVGLEWLFRLMTEPRRLWRRYLVDIPSWALKKLFSL